MESDVHIKEKAVVKCNCKRLFVELNHMMV